MTNEEQILEKVTALTQSHEAFIAEWRVTRDESKARIERSLAESERRRLALDKKSRLTNIIFIVFLAVVVANMMIPSLFGWIIVHLLPR